MTDAIELPDADTVRAMALAEPEVARLRERAEALAGLRDDARTEVARAEAAFEASKDNVREQMLVGGDYQSAAVERERLGVLVEAARLKADDLGAAAEAASKEHEEFAAKVLRLAFRRLVPAARDARYAAAADLRALEERHKAELAAAREALRVAKWRHSQFYDGAGGGVYTHDGERSVWCDTRAAEAEEAGLPLLDRWRE